MDAKTAFLAQIIEDLPDGIKEHLETPIPALVATTSPTDVDSAIIAQGILAHNLNLIFKAFEGLTLAAIPMYISQLNTVNQGMLLSALEFIGGAGDFRIISPSAGGSYPGFFGVREGEWYAVEILRGDVAGVSCQIVENDAFDLTESEDTPGVWLAEWPTAIGYHNATFTVTFADGSTATKSASFTVNAYPTIPADGDEITATQAFEFSLDTQGDVYDSVQVETTDSAAEKVVTTLVFSELVEKWVGNIIVTTAGAVSVVVTLLGAGLGAAVYQEMELTANPMA